MNLDAKKLNVQEMGNNEMKVHNGGKIITVLAITFWAAMAVGAVAGAIGSLLGLYDQVTTRKNATLEA